MTDYRAELQRLVQAYDEHGGKWPDAHEQALFQAVEAARTALAQPEPEVSPWPVPGDAEGLAEVFWGRYEQPEPEVEELAQLIYEQAMIPAAEHCKTEVPAWTERGNSFAQDNARDCARAILARWGRPTIKPVPQVATPHEDYHEDLGPVLWWRFPIDEPPWCGMPNDSDWPGYHTHFTPLPAMPTLPVPGAEVG